MSSADFETVLRMAAAMGLGPDVVKQVRANPGIPRMRARGGGHFAALPSMSEDLEEVTRDAVEAAEAGERERRRPPRYPPRSDRSDLLKRTKTSHEVAIMAEGADQASVLHSSFMGLPKTSSNKSLARLQPSTSSRCPEQASMLTTLPVVTFDEMQVTKTHRGRYLVLRTISLPISMVGVQFMAEDVKGRAELVAIYNLPLRYTKNGSDLDDLFPLGMTLVIREPIFKMDRDGISCLVRLDSPTDFEIIRLDHPLFSTLSFATPSPVPHRPLNEGVAGPPQARLKANVRLARALEGMRHLDLALEQYANVIELDAGGREGVEGKKRVDRKFCERDTGKYTGVIEMRERGGGRGIIATRDIEAGKVILVEKALCLGEPPQRGTVFLLDFATKTAMDSSRLDLVANLGRSILQKHLPDGCACELCTKEVYDKPSDTPRREKLLAKCNGYRLSLQNFDWSCSNPFAALLRIRQELEA
ncbi:hypothetical protein Rt10032_c11g4525 [Rhodotorula toruloides]|uniref:Proteophosphoglycan ppg4 n=1 Tax=Rhodotorula toruloides TaxID=5286 RepID=A0A511KJF4_RHOTO|nr:hypothetical protein Rt10032_c11g4525 [Rhodotorula toruloides]